METKELWIQPYRDVVEQQIRLDDAARKDFDDFFSRLLQEAGQCDDLQTFTARFTGGPLFQEYTGLFQKYQSLVLTGDGKTVVEAVAGIKKQRPGQMALEFAKSKARQELNTVVSHALPDEVNRLRWGGLRSIPIIGDIIQWTDNWHMLKRIFKR